MLWLWGLKRLRRPDLSTKFLLLPHIVSRGAGSGLGHDGQTNNDVQEMKQPAKIHGVPSNEYASYPGNDGHGQYHACNSLHTVRAVCLIQLLFIVDGQDNNADAQEKMDEKRILDVLDGVQYDQDLEESEPDHCIEGLPEFHLKHRGEYWGWGR